jgi:methylase of polypeptide subunit release factors
MKKTVLEVGSGVGLCGLVAALHAERVVFSDYHNTLLDIIKENIKLNEFISFLFFIEIDKESDMHI